MHPPPPLSTGDLTPGNVLLKQDGESPIGVTAKITEWVPGCLCLTVRGVAAVGGLHSSVSP